MQTIAKMAMLAIATVAMPQLGQAQDADPPAEDVVVSPYLVSVAQRADASSRVASGFAVNADGYVLTSASLIGRDDDDTWFIRHSGAAGFIPASVVAINEDLGVALLKTDDAPLSHVATFASFDVEIGSSVQSLSVNTDGEISVSAGAIGNAALPTRSDPPVPYFVHNAIIQSDGYGGALLNRCGEVVGINVTNPNSSRRSARRLPTPDQSVYSLTLDPVANFLFENEIELTVAPDRCLSADEEKDAAVEQTKTTEAELGEAQRKLDELEAEREQAEAEQRERQAEAERLRAEADRLRENNEASEAEIEQADSAAAEAEALAEQASLKLSDLQTEIDTLREEIDDLREKLAEARQQLYYTIGGAIVLLLLVGFGLSIIIRNRGSRIADVSADLEAANEKLSATFADVECRGKDAQNAPHAFRVSGAALVRSPAGLVIGRQPASADIVLNHPEVSRDHARVQLTDGQLTIVDLNSTNGTFVNGVKLSNGEPSELRDGDELRFGQIVLAVKFIEE